MNVNMKYTCSLSILNSHGVVSSNQVYSKFILFEERKPTRCNNIDDLLSIVDVDY